MSILTYLLGSTRAAMLQALFLRPGASIHVRELARITGASPGSLHRELRALAEIGLLVRQEIGRQVHYRGNPACPVFDELVALLGTEISAPTKAARGSTAPARALHSPDTVYRVAARGKLHIPSGRLAALCRRYHVRRLSLFGSAARNEMTPDSDIDVLVEFGPGANASLFDIPALQDELSALFGGRRVDVATPEILDNPFRRRAISQELRTLYAA